MYRRSLRIISLVCLSLISTSMWAGGPLAVGGPTIGVSGQPMTWATGRPIQYRVDLGPLAVNPSGLVVVPVSTGVSRVQSMFNVWQSVPTANITYQNIGNILPTGAFTGGDVRTVADFDAVDGSCVNGVQSPIIFDADGSIFAQLIGDPNIIGFANICAVDAAGTIISGEGVLNGKFQDGVSNGALGNFELTAAEFNQAFTHEFGHFSGLDHSQINVDVFNQTPGACNADSVAGLPLMFPILECQARTTAGLPALAPDDAAWISYLYPVKAPAPAGKQTFDSVYGVIHGTVLFSDGITGAQGVNVIARQVDNPNTAQNESIRTAFSVVSGFRFTESIGQSVSCPDPANPSGTACNINGDRTGSRDTHLVGVFDIPALAGNYTITVESVDPGFVAGSGVGPLRFPIAMPGTAPAPASVTVTPGVTTPNIDIKLQNTPPRFDSFESSQLFGAPAFALLEVEGGQA